MTIDPNNFVSYAVAVSYSASRRCCSNFWYSLPQSKEHPNDKSVGEQIRRTMAPISSHVAVFALCRRKDALVGFSIYLPFRSCGKELDRGCGSIPILPRRQGCA